jgi:hypothetical protein
VKAPNALLDGESSSLSNRVASKRIPTSSLLSLSKIRSGRRFRGSAPPF